MPTTHQAYILAEGGRPFADYDAAEAQQFRLSCNVADIPFEVVSLPDGGFAVAFADERLRLDTLTTTPPTQQIPDTLSDVVGRDTAAVRNGSDLNGDLPPIGGLLPCVTAEDPARTDADGAAGASSARSDNPGTAPEFPSVFTLNVAPRAFMPLHLATLLGVGLVLFPHWLFAPLGDFAGFQNAALGASVLTAVRLGGAVLALASIGKFLYSYLLYRFVVTEDYVESHFGWIAREASKVSYAHIRTTCVVQAWWERLLVVGDVKIGTGATDQHEVVLQHISNPKGIERELERRYIPFVRAQITLGDRS